METGEKKCPQCAELVRAEARACRYCGFNFESASPAGDAAPKKKWGCGKILGIIVAVFVGLIILGAIIGPAPNNTSSLATDQTGEAGNQANIPAALKVSARELEAEYASNEAAAQQKYGNDPLEVTGVISSINLGLSDEPFLVLQGANQFTGPQAHLSESAQSQAASLTKGQAVTLRCGGVNEVIGTPMLKDCDIL